MKNKIMMSVLAIFALAIGVFAVAFTTGVTGSRIAMACCCCSGDSCPVKKKGASATETASCCDDCDCCDADSCPMKKKGTSTASSATSETAQPAVATETKSCDGSCCKHKKEKKDAPSV